VNSAERTAALLERRREAGRTERIWTTGEFVNFDVYRVPTELLVLNASNRRFRAEAQGIARQLGRPLDPDHDETSIIALLLDKEPRVDGNRVVGTRNKDTLALIADWNRRSQEQPLWVRPDGLVSNGNRRLAMLRRLAAEEGGDGHDWIDVVFMDEGFDEETLFEMEAREQLTEGLKVRYTKMNALLTLRDAAERVGIDWADPDSIREVAVRVQHLANNNVSDAKVQLQAVKYMGAYLNWRGTPDDYSALIETVERFRDFGRNMDWVASHDPDREAAMLGLCFEAIRSGSPHGDLRAIRALAQNDLEAFDALVVEVEALATEVDDEEEVTEEPAGEESERGEDDDNGEEVDHIGPRTAGQRRIAAAISGAARALQGEKDAPETRVRGAAAALSGVDPADVLAATSGVTREQVLRAIAAVLAWSQEAEQALAEARE
jgi:hypothetical protein